MSLLMDALRKAEEAKKKAAHENKSEESAPAVEEQQAETAVEKSTEPEIELSMAELDEVPTRAPVPNMDTPIEYEEDEEDYVLPSSIGSSPEGSVEMDAGTPEKPRDEVAAVAEFEQNNSPAEAVDDSIDPLAADRQAPEETPMPYEQESVAATESFGLDSFENEEESSHIENENRDYSKTESGDGDYTPSQEPEKSAADTVSPVMPEREEPGRGQGSRILVPAARLARERATASGDPRQKTARKVFAAKKSPLAGLANKNTKVLAASALVLVVVVFGAFFYSSLNQESTFNIPEGNYATTQFVDNGESLLAENDQLSIDAVVDIIEDTSAVGAVQNTAIEPVSVSGGLNELATAAGGAPDASDAVVAAEPVVIPEPSRSAAEIQPELIEPEFATREIIERELIASEVSRDEVVVTTIGAEDAVAPEPEPEPEEVVAVSTSASGNQPSVPAEATNLISFTRQTSQVSIDPNIERAYTAYQQGSLDQAEALYRQTIASDPRQRDALLGLASIAARKGDSTEALDLYSRLLARNPRDPIARAGLMELLPAGSASEQEAELKRLLDEHPDVAALSYAYGNFLASNQRWSEAQQIYFRALQLAKSDAAVSGLVNPDYAFNLAVSLEHLNQSEPAMNYYREALEYSANYPAGFDLAALRSRLASMAGSSSDER